ncbi:MAG: DUF177 domain-containing protein [Coriobacteriia bacterium]|nr:DUF177 domain-containing protein [Coriobacteriia bacterium]MCL2870909.1 DUF177 domain-containing protein [Coriobacteriia bacterium]
MSILIDLRSVIDEGVGASLTVKGTTANTGAEDSGLTQFKLGTIDFCCTTPANYELNFINAGECVQASGKVHVDLSTACVRCLKDFDFSLDAQLEETFFFTACEDEHGEPYPVIDESLKVDIEPLLHEALLVEAPFAPIHDSDCQGLCIKCGTDLNEGDCGCGDEPDANHPFAALKDLV